MRKRAVIGFGVCLCLLAAGCGEPSPDVGHSLGYETDRLWFRYPGNWKITDEQTDEFPQYVGFESPRSAAGSVLLFRVDDAMRLDEFIRTYRDFFGLKAGTGRGDEYTAEPPRLSEPRDENGWETVTEKLKVPSGKNDVPYTRFYLRKKSGGHVCFVIEQCPDADLAKVAPGFTLINDSLRIGGEPP